MSGEIPVIGPVEELLAWTLLSCTLEVGRPVVTVKDCQRNNVENAHANPSLETSLCSGSRRVNPEATTQARPWHLSLEFFVGASGVFPKMSAPSRKAESPMRISHASVKTTCVFLHSQIFAHG